MQRQAELAEDRLVRWLVAEGEAVPLDLDVARFRARGHRELITVDEDAHRETINLGNRAGQSGRTRRSRAVHKGLDHDTEQDGTAAAEHVAPADGRLIKHVAIAAARHGYLLTPLPQVYFTTYDVGPNIEQWSQLRLSILVR